MNTSLSALPLPDFDEWYVVNRSAENIALAKEVWCELEQYKMEVNRIQGLVKNNRHALATNNNIKRLQQKCEEQCALHEQLTEMQRELSLKKIRFRSCGVIKITHMQQAFYEQAERDLPKEVFHAIKDKACAFIRRKLEQARLPDKTRLADIAGLAELKESIHDQ